MTNPLSTIANTTTRANSTTSDKRIAQTNLGQLVRGWLAKYLPAKVQLGMPSLAAHFEQWEQGANYIIAGKQATGAGALALALAESFATSGGHIIWIGITEDLGSMSEQLMFKIAGLELAPAGSAVQLDAVAQCRLAYAHEQIGKMWIDFCNVDDCGDTEVEQEFLASMSSFKPTLIVVDESIFDEVTLNPFEVLVRQTHALRMVEELRRTNPMSSVLWHLPMPHTIDVDKTKQRPSLEDLPESATVIKPDVVLFTHRNADPTSTHNSELIVVANAYGPTGTLPMVFDSKHLTWHELDAAA
jgi:hypothetical protein